MEEERTQRSSRWSGGELVRTHTVDPSRDPRRQQFVAAVTVVDEDGNPVQQVKGIVRWRQRIDLSITDSKHLHFEEAHETDANGRFEQEVKGGASHCKVVLFRPGYLPMAFDIRKEEPEKVVRLVPLPTEQVRQEDLTYYMGDLRYSVGPLLANRGVGLSLEMTADGKRVRGWTQKREEADLWFEILDADLGHRVAEELAYAEKLGIASMILKDPTWTLAIAGRNGTQLLPITEPPAENLPEWLEYWTAPAEGYLDEVSGFSPLENDLSKQELPPGAVMVPSSFFVRKNGRYGRLEGLVVRLGSKLAEGQWVPERRGWEGDWVFHWEIEIRDGFAMQTRPLGHRILVPTAAMTDPPPGLEGAD